MDLTFVNNNNENINTTKQDKKPDKESIKQQAQEIYDSVMTTNPNFSQFFLQDLSTDIQGLKRINGFLLYSRLLKEQFWTLNPQITLQKIKKSADALFWNNLQDSEKLYFNRAAENINRLNGIHKTRKENILFYKYPYEKRDC